MPENGSDHAPFPFPLSHDHPSQITKRLKNFAGHCSQHKEAIYKAAPKHLLETLHLYFEAFCFSRYKTHPLQQKDRNKHAQSPGWLFLFVFFIMGVVGPALPAPHNASLETFACFSHALRSFVNERNISFRLYQKWLGHEGINPFHQCTALRTLASLQSSLLILFSLSILFSLPLLICFPV